MQKIKSLPPLPIGGRLYKREELSLFEKEGLPACAKPLRRRQGEIFEEYVFSITDSLVFLCKGIF
jgi:hypothetical protein